MSMMIRVTIFMGGTTLAFRYVTAPSNRLGTKLIIRLPTSTIFVFLSKMFEISNIAMAISE